MANNTYYSTFYPATEVLGAKGTTIAVVPRAEFEEVRDNVPTVDLSEIEQQLAKIASDVDLQADTITETMLRGDSFEQLVAARTLIDGKGVNTVIATFQDQQKGLNESFANKFDIIGTSIEGGTGYVLNASAVQTESGKSLASEFNEIKATLGEQEGTIERHDQVLVDKSGTTARSILSLTADGHVAGMVFTNDNTGKSEVSFLTSSFKVVDPSGTKLYTPFSISEGVITMTNVVVDTLKVGSVDTDSLAQFAISKTYSVQLSGNVNAPYNRSTAVMVPPLTIMKDVPYSDIEIEFFMRIRLGRYAGYFTLEGSVGDNIVVSDRIDYHAPSLSNLNGYNSFRMPFSYKRRFSDLPMGAITWTLKLTHLNDDDSGNGGFLEAGSNFFAEEIKR